MRNKLDDSDKSYPVAVAVLIIILVAVVVWLAF